MTSTSIKLPDYIITKEIYEEYNRMLVSAVHENTSKQVTLRLIPLANPADVAVKEIEAEFEWTKRYNFSRVLNQNKPHRTEKYCIQEMEYYDGLSLESYLNETVLSIPTAIAIAKALTCVVEELEYYGIIHHDLRPSHFLVNPENNEVKLVDLSNATQKDNFEDGIFLKQAEISLQYISPEQSGLTDVPLDHRSAYYYLGVIFYRLFTGCLPFESTDPNELVHAHIARTPVAPAEVNALVPVTVSKIIMKLLSKKPEDRYQTTRGIRHDLALCMELSITDISNFEPGRFDSPGQLVMPDGLYGRGREIACILEAFDRIESRNELVLVSGQSGIGKSSLIAEVKKRLEPGKALFVTGKFDQYVQNIPFEGVIKALKELVKKISGDQSGYWRDAILNAVGPLGQIILDVIPELGKVIGPQQPVEQLLPVETQNRFVNVFTNFINVFTKSEHPLVIFLDDLQWADFSSLIFLSRVTHSVEGSNLLLIGAYRDNEITDGHPLPAAIQDLVNRKSNLTQISLSPLKVDDIAGMTADIFCCPPAITASLAELLMGVTLGNPYFISETLINFHNQGFIAYDEIQSRWVWDLDHMTAHTKSASSQQLLTFKINSLSEPARRALTTASCIGSEFDLLVLSTLLDKTPQEIEEDLRQAVVENLLVMSTGDSSGALILTGGKYRFVHDQVQQAAYNLLTAQERDEVHINIGYFLLERLSADERDRQLFEIINHLNHHPATIAVPSERRRLAALNMDAGKKAKTSAAYSVAFAYFQKGKQMLTGQDWTEAYPLALDLHLLYAESAYLAGNRDMCLQAVAETLPYTKTTEDKTELHQVQIQCLIFNVEWEKALEVSLGVLKELGIGFPKTPGNGHIIAAYLRSKWMLWGKKIEELVDLPRMTDARALASMRVFQSITAIASQRAPSLYPLMVIEMVRLTLRYGISGESAISFATYGAIINAIETNNDAAYRFGALALKMVELASKGAARERTLLVYNIVNRSAGEHINNSLEPLRKSYQTGIEMGDLEYCTYASSAYAFHLLLSGKNLHWVKQEMLRFSQPPKAFSKYHGTHEIEPLIQIVSNLLGEGCDSVKLAGPYFDEKPDLSGIFAQKDHSRMFACFVYKMIIAYLELRFDEATGYANQTLRFPSSVKGTLFDPLYAFFFGLLNTAIYRKQNGGGSYLKAASAQRDVLGKLARQVPINFTHRFYLLEAEVFACQGKSEQAINSYDKAVRSAIDNGHLHEASIANELCGKYWIERGQFKTGLMYLRAALKGFQEWGCVIKERQLLMAFPEIVRTDIETYSSMAARDSIASTLDLSTLMKASIAISSEVVFDRLMEKLMHFAIENAGAQAGYFILDWGGELFIEAQRSVVTEVGNVKKIPLKESNQVPASIIEHVFKTRMDVVLHDAEVSEQFKNDPVIIARGVKSALCIPALYQGKVLGMLYLENNLAPAVFTNERTQLLKLLSGQIAVSIENALLYEKLEQKVAVRTAEIQIKNEEIERQRQLVEEKSRFKEQFFANMSHEIRTPMTAILGMSELIFDTPLNAKQLEYAKGIQYSSENLLAIINDVLDYSKIEAGKFSFVNKPFQIRDRMKRLGYILGVIAEEKGLKLDISVDADVSPKLIGDPIRLHQILLNLASNAVKFTDNGSVTVGVSVVSRERESEKLLFRVTDSGIGIPQDKLEYIFETFTRIDEDVNNKQSGTGLGLFIAKKLVEEQGGSMRVSSQLNQGTEFSFDLTFEICDHEENHQERDEAVLAAGLKVLLVEDNLFNQVVAEETLKKLIREVQVTIADNGEIALQKLSECSFDIVLMDVKMPVMDGYKATQAIRAREKETRVPILAFTSNANPAEAQKCLDAGMDDYITKPIEAKKLKHKIWKLLEASQQRKALSAV
jgi:predicted ATPase/signal transduction histidine kinase/ActR/RegA family two-component response regulator